MDKHGQHSVRLAQVLLLAASALAWLIPAAFTQAAEPAPEWQLHVPVLYYHHIACPPSGSAEPEYWTCPDQFKAQLSYLATQGWTAATGDQLAEWYSTRTCPPSKTFVVSFDDGDEDAYTNAAPILESLGMRGTFFVVPGSDGNTGSVSDAQIQDLAARGHAIGNHTLDHDNLRKLDPVELRHQIEGAQVALKQVLGYRPRTFAYPYGRFTDAVVQAVAESGFDLAFTVRAGAVESTSAPLLSKRIEIGALDSGADVLAKVALFADPCPGPAPDLAISKTATGTFKGWRLASSSVEPQQTLKRTHVKAGQRYSYFVDLKDPSNTPATFTLRLDASQATGARVAVIRDGHDITSAVAKGHYATGTIQPWSIVTLEIRVTPRASASRSSLIAVDLYATYGATGATDVVRASASF